MSPSGFGRDDRRDGADVDARREHAGEERVCVAWATGRLPSGMFSGTRPLVVSISKFSSTAKPSTRLPVAVTMSFCELVCSWPLRVKSCFALEAFDDQEAVALDGHVERIGADLDRALREVGIDGRDLHTEADLAGIGTAGGVGRRGADALRLEELVGEEDVGLLEADGAGVGDVVADDVDDGFGGLQAGERRGECGLKTHGFTPPRVRQLFG